MARKAMILKQKEEPKFSTRYYNRCKICGRPHAYLRDYGAVSYTHLRAHETKANTKYACAAKPCLAKKSSPICPQNSDGAVR